MEKQQVMSYREITFGSLRPELYLMGSWDSRACKDFTIELKCLNFT